MAQELGTNSVREQSGKVVGMSRAATAVVYAPAAGDGAGFKGQRRHKQLPPAMLPPAEDHHPVLLLIVT